MVRPNAVHDRPRGLGHKVAALLEERGWTQTRLAEVSGIDRADINRIVNERRDVRTSEVPLLAGAFGLELDELLRDVDLPTEVERYFETLVRVTAENMELRTRAEVAERQSRAVKDALQQAMSEWDQERADTRGKHRKELEAGEQRVAEVERVADELRGELTSMRAALASARARTASLEASVERLSAELSKNRAGSVLAGVLTGATAGYLAGKATGRDVDDFYDDEEED